MTVHHLHVVGICHDPGVTFYLQPIVLRISVLAPTYDRAMQRIRAWAERCQWGIQGRADDLHQYAPEVVTVDLVRAELADTMPPTSERAA